MSQGKWQKMPVRSCFFPKTPLLPRNMLASDGPFRPFKQEQFQFLGGDAFMYLQKWPLDLSLRDGARVCCAGFVVEGSLSIKPQYQAYTAFPAEILERVAIFGDKFFYQQPGILNSECHCISLFCHFDE